MQALDYRKIQTGELFILYIRVKTDQRWSSEQPSWLPQPGQLWGWQLARPHRLPPRVWPVPKSKSCVLPDLLPTAEDMGGYMLCGWLFLLWPPRL